MGAVEAEVIEVLERPISMTMIQKAVAIKGILNETEATVDGIDLKLFGESDLFPEFSDSQSLEGWLHLIMEQAARIRTKSQETLALI